jgi:hypothetical protein
MVVGIALLRRTPLFVVLVIAAVGGVVLTLVQYNSGSHMLALLFPWRISAILVPIATAAIVARLAALVPASRLTEAGAVVVVLALAVAGGVIMAQEIGYRTDDGERELFEYVRTHAGPSDVYLLPIGIPELGAGRGTQSTTFTPPPRPDPGTNLIPVDLQRFRLATGTPIYVDFKSVPYLDTEVLEWYQRLRRCESWYAGDWTDPGRAQDLRDAKITHVVAPASRPIAAGYLKPVHSDPAYIVYEIR